jgi:EmrB/QacA subfamily drug resistance transporter
MSDGATTTAPAEIAAPIELDQGRKRIVFITILLGMLLAALDQTIVSTSLPSIVGDLGGAGHVSWVVTAYLLAETIMTIVAGRLGDLFGRKLVFQISVVVFIGGSALSGVAQSLEWLVVARFIQGLGGGGLTVTATALIGDVIPLRERGRYQGALGAVFGITTVLGPLLGGWFTDNLSWRWDFFVNVPIGIVVVLLAARTLPSIRATAKPVIDYAGIVFISIGSSALILATSWGGSTYGWGSAAIITLFAIAVVALATFVFVEMRAVEPILPMRLFRSQVFTVCCSLSFVVGFAMLGSITFMPTFLQYVDGVSATQSGIRMLPLVAGLMTTALLTGVLVGRTGSYKIYPIIGMPTMMLGFFMLSRVNENTSTFMTSLAMVVVGLGIGLCMQVLTLVVQNTAKYEDLGVSTSGVTFFRTMGSAFGTAVFGTLYANFLTERLRDALESSPNVPPGAISNPEDLHKLPDADIASIVHAYASALDKVFMWAIPVAIIGFVLALALKQVPLRGTERAQATDLGEAFAMPTSQTSEERLARSVATILRRDRGRSLPHLVTQSGTGLTETEVWGLLEIIIRGRVDGGATVENIAAAHRLPAVVIEPVFTDLVAHRYISSSGQVITLTPLGEAQVTAFVATLKRWLVEQLSGWETPPESGEIGAALDRIATRIVVDDAARHRELEQVAIS